MGGNNSEALREAIAGMKEVQLMAEQKVGGLNMPGRRASMLGAPTLGRQATSSISAGETAAFLVFGDASNGTLYMYWTTAGYADGALAGFVPRKKVPAFKLKEKGGWTEIIKDCGMMQPKRYYEGWQMFIKAARSFEADFNFIGNAPQRPAAIFLSMPNLDIKRVEIGDTVDVMGCKAVAVLHEPAADAFKGVHSMKTELFVARAHEKGGTANMDW